MDERTHYVRLREHFAKRLDVVYDELEAMLREWEDRHLPPNFLNESEYPFMLSLEDLVANVADATDHIRKRNAWLESRPVTITIPADTYAELIDMLERAPRELPKLRALLAEQQSTPWTDEPERS